MIFGRAGTKHSWVSIVIVRVVGDGKKRVLSRGNSWEWVTMSKLESRDLRRVFSEDCRVRMVKL